MRCTAPWRRRPPPRRRAPLLRRTARIRMPLDDQIAQRQANFQAIGALGVPLYPNAFDASANVSELVERHGASSGEALDAERPEVRVAGRILGIRAFGKASFLVLSDGRSTIQAYLRQDALSERDWAIY